MRLLKTSILFLLLAVPAFAQNNISSPNISGTMRGNFTRSGTTTGGVEVGVTLNGSGTTFAGSKTIYVSDTQGTDTRTGIPTPYDVTKPFETMTAANNAASSGDLIYVLPGTYDEYIYLKNGVDWMISPGADIVFSGTGTPNGKRGVFSDDGAAVTCRIIAFGDLSATNETQILYVENAASNVYLQAVDCVVSGTSGNPGSAFHILGGTVRAYAKNISAMAYDTIWIEGGTVTVEADSIENTQFGNAIEVVSTGSTGAITIKAKSITATTENALELGPSGPTKISADVITGVLAIAVSGTAPIQLEGKIVNTGTGLPVIDLQSNNLTLRNCALVAEASATASINAGSAQTMKVYNSFANKAIDADVTQQVGTVTVSANVQ